MARIRSVHPGLFKDEAFIELSMAARVLAIGIWTLADDHGVFEWKPKMIRAEIFPGDSVEIDDLVAELVQHGCIIKFEDSGRAYGVVRNFCVYQRPRQPSYRHPFPESAAKYAGEDRRKAEELMQASSKKPSPRGGDSNSPAAALPQDTDSTTEKSPHRRGEKRSRREGDNPKITTGKTERESFLTPSAAPPPSAPETLSPKASASPSKGLATLGSPLPDRWVPDGALCAKVAADFGMTEEDLQHEVLAFHAYNASQGTYSQSWPDTFYLFCKRWKEHKDRQAPPRIELQRMPGSGDRYVPTEADWDRELGFYAKTGRWTSGIGPDPMSPACKAPRELYAKHGINVETGERTIPPRTKDIIEKGVVA